MFNSFRQILDKGIWSNPPAGVWNIRESDPQASFCSLDITFQGDLLALDKASYQGVKISAKILDRDCDGFAFYHSVLKGCKKTIIAVELKSGFNRLNYACEQLVYTYLKMHSLLSRCDGYNCLDYIFLGVIACHPPKDKYISLLNNRKNAGESLSFKDEVYQASLVPTCKSIALSQVHFLEGFHLPPDLQQQKLHLYLHLTDKVDDVHSTLNLRNVLEGIGP